GVEQNAAVRVEEALPLARPISLIAGCQEQLQGVSRGATPGADVRAFSAATSTLRCSTCQTIRKRQPVHPSLSHGSDVRPVNDLTGGRHDVPTVPPDRIDSR